MLYSIALLFLVGSSLGWGCKKIGLPSLVGMLIAGILLGPYCLNVLDTSLLDISSDIRRMALIIILTRAGLSLNIGDLKKVGRPAILLCFVPACFEIVGVVLLAPRLFGISLEEALLMGSVIAAVSPAVIVPKMIRLIEEEYGTKKGIPQMILAGASVDDVFVIVLFSSFLSLNQGTGLSVFSFIDIPISIVLGILIGVGVGWIISMFLERIKMQNGTVVMFLLSICFVLVSLEDVFTFASLISVMCMGMVLKQKVPTLSMELSETYNRVWKVAEVFLFTLVGASVNIQYALSAGLASVVLVFGALLFRMFGVFLCLLNTNLSSKERLFCVFAYMPKATVQAAIGGVALANGLECGSLVLTVAVVSILITAPLGATLIERSYKNLLT